MTTAGDNITKANIVASMAALSSTYNAGINWASDNQPFQTDITGGPTSGYAQTLEADISDTNITASTIVVNFRAYARLLSRIRIVRLLKYYQIQGDVRARTDYDNSQITNLTDAYAAAIPGGLDWVNAGTQPISDATITASGLDAFVNNLSTVINDNRTSQVTIEEFYCHSNCHGSCHGSI
jgi:hypothetical protein